MDGEHTVPIEGYRAEYQLGQRRDRIKQLTAERDGLRAALAELLRVDTEPATHAAIVAARAQARALLAENGAGAAPQERHAEAEQGDHASG